MPLSSGAIKGIQNKSEKECMWQVYGNKRERDHDVVLLASVQNLNEGGRKELLYKPFLMNF